MSALADKYPEKDSNLRHWQFCLIYMDMFIGLDCLWAVDQHSKNIDISNADQRFVQADLRRADGHVHL